MLEHISDRHARLSRRNLQDGVYGASSLQASVSGASARPVGVPVTPELLLQSLIQFLAEDVHSASRQFIVQVRYDEVEGDLHFNMHFWSRCGQEKENVR